jgi:hypothetical protein
MAVSGGSWWVGARAQPEPAVDGSASLPDQAGSGTLGSPDSAIASSRSS